MITTGVVKKYARYTCDRCGLNSRAPIVVSSGELRGELRGELALGVCSNKKACERRQVQASLRRPKETP